MGSIIIPYSGGALGIRTRPEPLGTVTVDPTNRFQVWDGLECNCNVTGSQAPAGSAIDLAWENARDDIFDVVFGDIGYERLRLDVGCRMQHSEAIWSQRRSGAIDSTQWSERRYSTEDGSTFQYAELDDDMTRCVVPALAAAAALGVTPTVTMQYVGFAPLGLGAGYTYGHDDPAEYAAMVVAAFTRARDTHGVTFDALDLMLEPDFTGATIFGPPATTARANLLGTCLVAIAEALDAAGFNPRFYGPSAADMNRAGTYIDAWIANVPDAVEYLTAITYHLYGSNSDDGRRRLVALARSTGKLVGMSEYWSGTPWQNIVPEMRVANATWHNLAGTLTGDHGADVDSTDPDNPVVTWGAQARYVRQYAKRIRRGDRRIDAFSLTGNIIPVAFVKPDGKFVVTARIITSSQSNFTFGGLPDGTYGVSHASSTSAETNLTDVVVSGGSPLVTVAGPIPVGAISVYQKS